VAGGKRASEGKSKLSHKRTAIDLEMEINMLHKYERGQSLSAIVLEFGFAVTTVITVVKDAAHMKEHMNFIFHLMHVCLSISTV
jgi:hypothetical protein